MKSTKNTQKQNPRTLKVQEQWSKTREHIRHALSNQAALAKQGRRPKFNFVDLPEEFTPETRELCLAKLVEAEQVLVFGNKVAEVAGWFNTRYAYYESAPLEPTRPIKTSKTPKASSPKAVKARKPKATKAQKVQAARMRLAKAVKAKKFPLFKTAEYKTLLSLVGPTETGEYISKLMCSKWM